MKFSVIIPVYNVVTELPRTMDSLMAQTFRDFGIVLVDDGSTDGSAVLVDSYAKVATVIHQPNSGVVVARQKGFEASKGEWILFVDGDDAIKPETLARVSEEIERTHSDVIQFGYDLIKRAERQVNAPYLTGCFTTDELIGRMKKSPLEFVGMCIWNKCYRRDIAAAAFADVGDVNISHSEDGLFAFAAFLRAKSISMLSDCLYEYILRESSAVHRVNTMIVDEKERFISRLEKLMTSTGRMDVAAIERCLDFHCYEAACTSVFLMLKRNRASRSDCQKVLKRLSTSHILRRRNREWCTLKRRVMLFLLKNPRAYCFFKGVIEWRGV